MNQITIIGCGLIGGSFALGLKEHGFAGEITGCDRPEVLEAARRRGAVDRGTGDLGEAVSQADLVYLSTPVSAILDLLPRVAELVRPGTLITDTGGTKGRICRQAAESVPAGVFFLGGHPMAGREVGGIENAEASLFAGAKYALIEGSKEFTTETPFDPPRRAQGGQSTQSNTSKKTTETLLDSNKNDSGAEPGARSSPPAPAGGAPVAEALRLRFPRLRFLRLCFPRLRSGQAGQAGQATGLDSGKGGEAGTEGNEEEKIVDEFLGWVRKMGAEPVWLDAETHDRAAAWVSHLPQLLSTALAASVADVQEAGGLPGRLAGRGFRDMVRLGSSPYEVWRDIFLTNQENIARALSRMEQELAHLRENLTTKDLAEEFQKARGLAGGLKPEKKREWIKS